MEMEKVINMNKVIQRVIKVLSFIVCVLSIVFILYGSIKLARVEEAIVSQDIESGIPGIEIVEPSNIITGEDAQRIVSISVASLLVGVTGLFISSRVKIREGVSSSTQAESITQPYNTLDKTDQSSNEQ
jgi:hypothetical protein